MASADFFVDVNKLPRPPPSSQHSACDERVAWQVYAKIPEGLRFWLEFVEGDCLRGLGADGFLGTEILGKFECFVRPLLRAGLNDVQLRTCVQEEFVRKQVPVAQTAFLLLPNFGIPDDFARFRSRWDDELPLTRAVCARVDKFVSLLDVGFVPQFIVWTPHTTVVEDPEWRPGMIHEPVRLGVWQSLHKVSKWVLSWVVNKVWIKPAQRIVPSFTRNDASLDKSNRAKFDAEKFEFVQRQIRVGVKQNVMFKRGRHRPTVVNRLSTAPKAGPKKFRLITDMRKPNKKFHKKKVKLETLRHVPDMLTPDSFCVVLDWMQAYYAVAVQDALSNLIGFWWEGSFYSYRTLCFGFSLSPWIFVTIGKQIVKHLRFLGFKILLYIDDSLVVSDTFVSAVRDRNRVMRLCEDLGFRYAAKSDAMPWRTFRFLGVVAHLNTPEPTFHIPHEKQSVMLQGAVELYNLDSVPVKQVAKTIGRVMWMSVCCWLARVMTHELYKALYDESVDWHSFVRLHPGARAELQWIVTFMSGWLDRGVPVFRVSRIVDADVMQDSSAAGCGFQIRELGILEPVVAGTILFQPWESELFQCYRELWGLCLLALSAPRELRSRNVSVTVDAEVSRCYLLRGGTSRVLNNMVKVVLAAFAANGTVVEHVRRISSLDMEVAGTDGLSRPVVPRPLSEEDRAEWRLGRSGFCHIQQVLGVQFTVDRFASRVNAQCVRFFSRSYEPEAGRPVDAFASDWAGEVNWCFPPMSLVPRVVRHLRQCKAWGCILMPNWPSNVACHAAQHAAVSSFVLPARRAEFFRLVGGQWERVQHSLAFSVVVLDFVG